MMTPILNTITLITAFLSIAFMTQSTFAANRTWDGGGVTNNWSEAANWSDNTVPASDTAIFDGTSTKNCLIDIDLPTTEFLSINLNSGYIGTVSIAPGVNTNFRAGGVFASGIFTASGGTVSFPQNIVSITGGTFNAGSGTTNIAVLIQSAGAFNGSTGIVTSNGITINGGTFNSPSGTLEIGGNLTINAGTVDLDNGTISFVGATNNEFVFGSATTVNNFTVNKPAGGGLQFSGTASVTGTLTLTNGVISAGIINPQNAVNIGATFGDSFATGGTGTLRIQDGASPRTITIPAGARLPNVTVNDPNVTINTSGSGTIVCDDFILTAGVVNIGANNWVQGFPQFSGNQAPFTQNGGTFTSESGNFTMNTLGSFTLNNGTFNAGTGTFTNESTNFVNGGTFNASTGDTIVKRGFTVGDSATFNHNNGTVTLANNGVGTIGMNLAASGVNFNNLAFNVGVTFSGGNPIVNGTFTQVSGSAGAGQIQVKGNMQIESGALGGTPTVLFNGPGNQVFTNNGGTNFSGTWTINKPSGVLSLASNLTLGTSQALNITAGEFSQGASSDLRAGPVTVGASGFWRNNGTGDITLGGNVTNAGEIDIDGTTISCDEADAILIRSTVNGTPRSWTGTGTFFVQDADVRDQSGTAAITSFAGTDSGNNGPNWTFNSVCAPFVWDGGGATNNWTEAANWRRNLLPLATTVIVFDGTSVKNAFVDTNIAVDGIQINSGYTGTISWLDLANQLTVGSQGFSQSGGSVQSGRLTANGNVLLTGGIFQVILTSLLDVNGNFSAANSNLAFAPNANTTISGNLTLDPTVSFNPGTHLILDSNTPATLNVPSNTQFNNLTIDKTSNAAVEINPAANLIVNGQLSLTRGMLNGFGFEARGPISVGGQFAGGTGSVTIQNAPPFTGGTISDGAVLPEFFTLNSADYQLGVANLNGTVTFQNFNLFNGRLSASSTLASTVVFNGLYLQQGGEFFYGSNTGQSLVFNDAFTLSSGTFRPISATSIDMNGVASLNGGTFTANSGSLFISNNFRINGSTFNHNNGTVNFDSPVQSLIQVGQNQLVFNNVSFTSPDVTFLQTLDGTSWITANGAMNLSTGGIGKLPASPAIPSFRAEGDVSMTNFNFITLLSLLFQGTANQTLTQTGGSNFNGWTVNKTAGTLNLAQDTAVETLFLQNGTITTSANILTPSTLTRTAGFVIGNLRQDFTAPASKTFHVGTASGYSPVTANVTAVNLAQGAVDSLTVAAISGTAPSNPPLLDATTLNRYWQLTETGDLTADLTFSYLQVDVDGGEASYAMIRSSAGGPPLGFPNGSLCPGVGSPCVDTTVNTIFVAGVTSFNNFWTAGSLAPTAASVTVGGRVLSDVGRGIYKARVTLTDMEGGSRTALTNPFGYYRFDGVPAGQSYVVSVRHKAYQFANPSRIIFVADDLTDVDFIAMNQAATNSKPSISGRVANSKSEGLADVSIELSTAGSKHPIVVKTDKQGYYTFEDLVVGETYFIFVNSKLHRFTDPTRVLTLLEDVTDADFVSEPF